MMQSKVISQEELSKQRDFAAEVRFMMSMRAGARTPRAQIVTFGCQQNVADSEQIRGMLSEMGFQFTENQDEADLILYNTCAVREHAEHRVFGHAGALKHVKARRPSTVIGLCGCMMQQPAVAERIRRTFPHIDLVFGTHVLYRLPEHLYRVLTGGTPVYELPDEEGRIAEGLLQLRDSGIKAFLPIMYGCDNYCSYCIVPYVRGRERSRASGAILRDARELIEAGCREITLLGQNVNSYGKGLAEDIDFAGLLSAINAIPGDFKIRFMTSHPKDASRELIKAMTECEKVARHLHLPFQSGSDRVLGRMNRGYTRARYLSIVDDAKRAMPNLSLTSDVIVGFPGETYEDFCDTLDLIRQVEFTSLFTFIFSPRPGTPAAEMEDPVPREEKSRWFAELLSVQEGIAARRSAALVGETLRVLCEGAGKNGALMGRTEGNVVVEFPGDPSWIGQYVPVRVTEAGNWVLKGLLESRG